MASTGGLRLFALEASRALGERVAECLEVNLSQQEEREFADGEFKIRSLVDVAGADVYVLMSLHGQAAQSACDKLCRLLFFLGSLGDAGAARVTAVTPYLCFSRKDQRTQPNDPIATRYVAQLFEAIGIDALLTLDVHNRQAFDNSFRRPTVHIEAMPLFVRHFHHLLADERLCVVSPDLGGVKRAERFRQALAALGGPEPTIAFVEKYRAGGVVSGGLLVGEVKDRTVLLLDDLISTGTTLSRAAERCKAEGARAVYAAATHGLLAPGAEEALVPPALDGVVLTDTVESPLFEDPKLKPSLTLLGSAQLIAEAIVVRHRSG